MAGEPNSDPISPPAADPAQPTPDDAAAGPAIAADDMVPTRDDPAAEASAAHPS